MLNEELTRRLDGLIPSNLPVGSPWDDLARGRSARRRRRVVTSAGVVVAVGATAGALWLVPLVTSNGLGANPEFAGGEAAASSRSTSYASALLGPSGDQPEYVPEQVSADVAAARCVSGVQSAVPTASADPSDLIGGPFLAGDLVEIPLAPNQSDAGSCPAVPGPLAQAPYPYISESVVATDTDAILRGCGAWLRIDLTAWTVGAAMADGYGGVAATLVSPQHGYVVRCELQASFDLSGFTDVIIDNHTSLPDIRAMPINERMAAQGTLFFEQHFSSCYPTGADCSNATISMSDVLPAGMESAIVELSDGTTLAVPVGPQGTFALRFVAPVDSNPQIHTYDADGVEVGTWSLAY